MSPLAPDFPLAAAAMAPLRAAAEALGLPDFSPFGVLGTRLAARRSMRPGSHRSRPPGCSRCR